MIGPAQAERKIGTPGVKDLIEGPLKKNTPTTEPIMVIAEALNAVLAGHFCLIKARLFQAQIIEPQIRGNTRLIMPSEQRTSGTHVCPLCEPRAPPLVVFGYWIILR